MWTFDPCYDMKSAANGEGTHEYAGTESRDAHRPTCHSRFVPSLSTSLVDTLFFRDVDTDIRFLFSFASDSSRTPIHPEGYIGMALVGGAAALGTLLVASVIRRATRK